MTLPLSNARLSELIGTIYDCTVDPVLWPDTLTSLRNALDFRIAALVMFAWPAGDFSWHATSGIDPEWLLRLGPTSGRDILELWGGRENAYRIRFDDVHLLSRITSNTAWETAAHRVEWDLPLGIADWLSFQIGRDEQVLGTIGFGQHVDDGPINRRQIEAARLLVPHCQRAVAISRLLDIKAVTAATLEATLDALSNGVMLVDADLHILHANRAAEAMLRSADTLRSRHGRLSLNAPGAAAALAVAVRQAAADESGIGRKGLNVPVSGPNNVGRVLHVLPLRHGLLRPGLTPSAVAAVFVAPVGLPSDGQLHTMRALFDLTAAETRVLEQIAVGRDIAETAGALEISAATVKTPLQRLFDKTGTRRQVELVALASSFALPVQG